MVGYTDNDRIVHGGTLCKNGTGICTNEALGLARAESVADYIRTHWSDMPETAKIKEDSAGDKCATGTKKEDKASDRKVQFWVFFGDEDTNIDDDALCKKPEDE